MEYELYVECHAYVSEFGKSFVYEACLMDKCQKKLKVDPDGHYCCPEHGRFSKLVKPKSKFSLQMELSDFTGSIRASLISDDIAKTILELDAEQVASM